MPPTTTMANGWAVWPRSRLEVQRGGFQFHRPGEENAFARPKGHFRQEALFRLHGRQLLFLAEGR